MSTKRRYKQWKRDPNFPIPKRTLSRLKKGASSIFTSSHKESILVDECSIQRQGTQESEHTDNFEQHHVAEVVNDACQVFSEDPGQSKSIFSDNCFAEKETETLDEILTERNHLKEETDFRDSDSEEAYYCCESDDENSDLEIERNANTPQPLYPGASITIEDSILSIMKYALRHKMSYSALSDLLNLITLHIPSESHTQHLQSLYFLKKAFASQSERNGHEDSDLVTVHEYCPTCMALWKNDLERICRICGTQRRKKTNNYFLALDIGAQLKSLLNDPKFVSDIEYGLKERQRVQSSLERQAQREWFDIMDGDLYRELIKPGGFLTNPHNFSLLFNTDGVHAFKASKDEIWPLLVVINEIHPSVRFSVNRMILAGIWFGPRKPSMTSFLSPFREQVNNLKRNGVTFSCKEKMLVCRAVCLVGTADLPGKSAVQSFTQFNGKSGCSFCEDEGKVVAVGKGHSRAYPYIPGPPKKPRTKDSVFQHGLRSQQLGTPVYGVKMVSQLCLIDGFDIVRGMPLDYMHGVLLGVVKMLFSMWFDIKYKKEPFYIGDKVSIVDERLLRCHPPDFISRLPRGLKDRKYWKASEVRSWLLYYSLPVLKGILPDDFYCHYALLATSIYLLLQQPVTQAGLLLADKQLEEFYALMAIYYGEPACTINVHNTCKHITSSVRLAGPLWAFSCFGTEGWNGTMMKLIHGTHHVAIQVVAAIKAIRMVNVMENSNGPDKNSTVSSFMQSLNKSQSSSCIPLFPGCFSIGYLEKVELGFEQLAAINELIPGAAVNVEQAFQFKKINFKKQVFYSKSCSKVKKRNSYTIAFVGNDGTLKIGMISYFLKVLLVEDSPPCHLAAVQELHPHYEGVTGRINVTTLNKELGCHLRPYRHPSNEETLSFISIEDIQSKQVVTDCLPESNVMYICSPPNLWEMD